jgi:hypothetical protein
LITPRSAKARQSNTNHVVIFRSSSPPRREKLVLLVVRAERQPHAKRVSHIQPEQMSERAAIDFAAGRSRIFISGQSAGGAILPYGCAAPVQLIRDYSLKTPDLPPCRSQPCTNREEGRRRWTSQPSRSYQHGNDLAPRAGETLCAREPLPSASQTGRCRTSMTGEKPVWELRPLASAVCVVWRRKAWAQRSSERCRRTL